MSALTLKNVTDYMYQYGTRVSRSVDRCALIAESERVMGYEESASAYLEMSKEISATRGWLNTLLNEMVPSDA